jgi:pSer/pThr/pTyr-binding forkhead associated (FHA) protein
MLKLRFRDNSKPDMWLVDPLISIGSDVSCSIVIASPRVDAYHAEIRVDGDKLEFVHRSKTKSSFINGALIAADMTLKPWDVIKIGETELEIVDPVLNRSPRKTQATQQTQVREVLSDWLLQAQTEPFSGQLFPVNKNLVIGRELQCDIHVPLAYVSRRHAEISVADGQLKIKDLGSANGTYINGVKQTEAVLQDGDEIRLDQFRFKVISIHEHSDKKQQEFRTTIRESSVDLPSMQKPTTKYPTPAGGMDTISDHMLEERAFFHGRSKDIRGKVYEVSSKGSPIGRMLGHHLSRDETSVSARHVEVFKKGRFWSIINKGAANGLLVNGRMTTRATLVDGDEVTIGGMELIFQCEGDTPRAMVFDDQQSGWDIGRIAIAVAIVGAMVVVALGIFLD